MVETTTDGATRE